MIRNKIDILVEIAQSVFQLMILLLCVCICEKKREKMINGTPIKLQKTVIS